jgi:hypothetical protein
MACVTEEISALGPAASKEFSIVAFECEVGEALPPTAAEFLLSACIRYLVYYSC